MQTARVTILMTPDKKAAFDAVAASRGQSVGEFFRTAGDEAANKSASAKQEDEEAALELLAQVLEETVPRMREDLEAMQRSIRETRAALAAYRAERDATRSRAA
jgi:signal transduction protein with GAF and PtsI domain